jgi:hypothetical protein
MQDTNLTLNINKGQKIHIYNGRYPWYFTDQDYIYPCEVDKETKIE